MNVQWSLVLANHTDMNVFVTRSCPRKIFIFEGAL